jgi:tetratricopeptide (TPR) repeat protein
MRVRQNYTELIGCGKQHELDDDPKEAIRCYEDAISQNPIDVFPFSRLMILYRKEKNYEDELRVINKAIDTFTAFYDKKFKKFSRPNKLGQASKALLKHLNKNDKGLDEYPAPLPAWMKRKEMVEQKLGQKKTKRKTKQTQP